LNRICKTLINETDFIKTTPKKQDLSSLIENTFSRISGYLKSIYLTFNDFILFGMLLFTMLYDIVFIA